MKKSPLNKTAAFTNRVIVILRICYAQKKLQG